MQPTSYVRRVVSDLLGTIYKESPAHHEINGGGGGGDICLSFIFVKPALLRLFLFLYLCLCYLCVMRFDLHTRKESVCHNFDKLLVIIDCFQISEQRHQGLLKRRAPGGNNCLMSHGNTETLLWCIELVVFAVIWDILFCEYR